MLRRLWIFVLTVESLIFCLFVLLIDVYFVKVCVHGTLIHDFGTYYEVYLFWCPVTGTLFVIICIRRHLSSVLMCWCPPGNWVLVWRNRWFWNKQIKNVFVSSVVLRVISLFIVAQWQKICRSHINCQVFFEILTHISLCGRCREEFGEKNMSGRINLRSSQQSP